MSIKPGLDWHPRRPAPFLVHSVVFFGFLVFVRFFFFFNFFRFLSCFLRIVGYSPFSSLELLSSLFINFASVGSLGRCRPSGRKSPASLGSVSAIPAAGGQSLAIAKSAPSSWFPPSERSLPHFIGRFSVSSFVFSVLPQMMTQAFRNSSRSLNA